METTLIWKEGMVFTAEASGNLIKIDAKKPLGKEQGATPKELVAMGMAGCTGMDVIALLKKAKEPVENFSIHCEVETTEGVYPSVFTKAHLIFQLTGSINPEKVIESVKLSQSKYCGVSAMLSKAFPITWEIKLNGKEIATGKADFP